MFLLAILHLCVKNIFKTPFSYIEIKSIQQLAMAVYHFTFTSWHDGEIFHKRIFYNFALYAHANKLYCDQQPKSIMRKKRKKSPQEKEKLGKNFTFNFSGDF